MTPPLGLALGSCTIACYELFFFSEGFLRVAAAFLAAGFPLVSGLALFRPWGRLEPQPAAGRVHFHGRGRFMGTLGIIYLIIAAAIPVSNLEGPRGGLADLSELAMVVMAGLLGAIGSFGVAIGWSMRRTDVVVDDDGIRVYTRGELDWWWPWEEVAKIYAYHSVFTGPKGAPIQYQGIEVTSRAGATSRVDGKRLPDRVMSDLKGELRNQVARRTHVEWAAHST